MSVKDLHPALYAFLVADTTIAGLVANGVGKYHIYPNVLPAGVKATSIVYQEISAPGDHHNEGPSGLARPRMQIAAWALTPPSARALAIAIKNYLDGYKGTMGSGGGAVTVKGAFFDDWRDVYDGTIEMHGKQADYFIWFDER